MKKFLAISASVVFTAAILFAACNKSDDAAGTRSYLGTQSPGDVWSWSIITDSSGNGTFVARNETLSYDYSGTVSTLPNRFLKLLLTATTDPAITTLPGTAYAIEVPNTLLIVKPAGAGDNVIVAVALGECPTQSAIYNMIEMPNPGWNPATDSAYTVVTTAVSGANIDASIQPYLLNGTPLTPNTETGFTCSGGRITRSGDTGVLTITPSGMMITDAGPGQGGTAGMQAPAANVDLADVVLTGREYRAVSFKDADIPGSDDSKPHWARSNGTGGLSAGDYLDFEAGTEDSANTSTITFGSQNSPGVVNGTGIFTEAGGGTTTTPMVFMINKINDKYFIYGIMEDTGAGLAEIFLIIEQ